MFVLAHLSDLHLGPLPVPRLADTVLIGDAVSAHDAADFSGGTVGVEILDGDGRLDVRIGPLVAGGSVQQCAHHRHHHGADAPGLSFHRYRPEQPEHRHKQSPIHR